MMAGMGGRGSSYDLGWHGGRGATDKPVGFLNVPSSVFAVSSRRTPTTYRAYDATSVAQLSIEVRNRCRKAQPRRCSALSV